VRAILSGFRLFTARAAQALHARGLVSSETGTCGAGSRPGAPQGPTTIDGEGQKSRPSMSPIQPGRPQSCPAGAGAGPQRPKVTLERAIWTGKRVRPALVTGCPKGFTSGQGDSMPCFSKVRSLLGSHRHSRSRRYRADRCLRQSKSRGGPTALQGIDSVYCLGTVRKASHEATTAEEVKQTNGRDSRRFPAQRGAGARH
jgi:hypothetical protein